MKLRFFRKMSYFSLAFQRTPRKSVNSKSSGMTGILYYCSTRRIPKSKWCILIPKLNMRVRFPSPAPAASCRSQVAIITSVVVAFLLPAFAALFQLTQPLVWYQFPKAQLHVADGCPEVFCAEASTGFLKKKAAGPFDRLGCFLIDGEEAPHTSGKGSRLVWASPKKKRKSWISVSIMRPWCSCRMASW